MKAVIMAGGKGTRVQSIAPNLPKPMIPILGKPILQYQIENLVRYHINDIILVVGYQKQAIIDYFQNGSKFNAHISYIVEDTPLDTGGALYYLKEIKEDFLFLFGDLIFDIDFDRFITFHKSNNATITLFGHPNSHPYDSDLLITDLNNRLIGIIDKSSERNYYYHNLTNAGIYCLNPFALRHIFSPSPMSFEKDILQPLITTDNVFVYRSSEYVKDAGTIDRIEQVQADLANGIVAAKNLSQPQKAIFLDRDGTINEYKDKTYVTTPESLVLLPNSSKAISLINSSQYLAIVITNQPIIARGEITIDELNTIHYKMETELGNDGAYLDDLFYCPHHPDKGFPGEISELKIKCNCRKPKIGLFEQASQKYNISLKDSWMIGDNEKDIKAGKRGNMHTIYVKSGSNFPLNIEPDYITNDLLEAVRRIL